MPLNFCLYLVHGCCQTNGKICVKIPLRRKRDIKHLKACMVLPIHIFSTSLVFSDLFEMSLGQKNKVQDTFFIVNQKVYLLHNKEKLINPNSQRLLLNQIAYNFLKETLDNALKMKHKSVCISIFIKLSESVK